MYEGRDSVACGNKWRRHDRSQGGREPADNGTHGGPNMNGCVEALARSPVIRRRRAGSLSTPPLR
jgi:hypothetical protein